MTAVIDRKKCHVLDVYYPQEIKEIYNRIEFVADKFALPITYIFGHPYESRELRILSVVGQNV